MNNLEMNENKYRKNNNKQTKKIILQCSAKAVYLQNNLTIQFATL